jgi:hypothetical protein
LPQILSIENPVEKRKVATVVVNAVNMADAMGLFPRHDNLDAQTVENLLAHLHRAGIGQGIQIDSTDADGVGGFSRAGIRMGSDGTGSRTGSARQAGWNLYS